MPRFGGVAWPGMFFFADNRTTVPVFTIRIFVVFDGRPTGSLPYWIMQDYSAGHPGRPSASREGSPRPPFRDEPRSGPRPCVLLGGDLSVTRVV